MARANERHGLMGRPPVPDEERKSKIVPIRFTYDEYWDYIEAAQLDSKTLSEWIRDSLNQEVSRLKRINDVVEAVYGKE